MAREEEEEQEEEEASSPLCLHLLLFYTQSTDLEHLGSIFPSLDNAVSADSPPLGTALPCDQHGNDPGLSLQGVPVHGLS